MTDEPRNEDDFLKHESRLAREALVRLRGEAIESLGRTADVNAWTRCYPWQSLGTAAVAGVSAGWALGRTFRRKSTSPESDRGADRAADSSEADQPHAAQRLMSGLGTLTGALASAAFTAVAESLTEVVKGTVRDAINPQAPETNKSASDDADSADSTDTEFEGT